MGPSPRKISCPSRQAEASKSLLRKTGCPFVLVLDALGFWGYHKDEDDDEDEHEHEDGE
jgi:hypothetical protein